MCSLRCRGEKGGAVTFTSGGRFGLVGTLPLRCEQETLSPVTGERAVSLNVFLVVVVNLGGCRFVEVARGANRLLAGVRARKPGGFVPGQVVGGVHVFGVWRVLLASEDLRLLRHPASPQSLNRRTLDRD